MLIAEYTDDELAKLETGACLVFDIECYKNYFLIAFRHITTDKHIIFEIYKDKPLEDEKLRWLIWRSCLVGFNSNNYDLLMLTMALYGYDTEHLKTLSDHIVFGNLRPHQFEKEYATIPQLNHIDLIEVAPLEGSLKLYGARLHCKHVRELPYPHDRILSNEETYNVKEYCCNDLDITKLLLIELHPHIELRQSLGREYGRDMRSLSDAQVAEAIIGVELYRTTGVFPRRPTAAISSCSYKPPPYLRFQTKPLQAALETITAAHFAIGDNGSPIMPKAVSGLLLSLGGTTYKLGIGGLHSQESEAAYIADQDTYLIDRDVTGYYPNIVINNNLYPKHLGPAFIETFKGIVRKRLAAKRAGNKKVSEGLKIASNGTFGKLGNKYSFLYSPDLLLQVTITGQLCLLLLIEAIEMNNIPVVSGNTDGIVIKCQKNKYELLERIIKAWEKLTGFETEETKYKAIYSRDVNNYIAIKEDNSCKTKGIYSEKGSAQNSVLSKNPECLIISEAIQKLLTENVSIVKTIRECKDIRKFVLVRRVTGGAEKQGKYLGKVVRWYYAKGVIGTINYCKTGNKVPKSESACPLMIMPDFLPTDINYDYYIQEATESLFDIGYYKRPNSGSLFD